MTTRFSHGSLHAFTNDVFQAFDLPGDDARLIADGLIEANLRGLDSHGVARIPVYAERLRRGLVNPKPEIRIEDKTPVAALVDGDNGMGFVVGDRAMAKAIDMAGASGIGLVAVRRSTHYGRGAIYVLQAIEAGFISLAFTNSSPALPVWGGRSTFLGAAPLAAGVPAGEEAPYVLDMAMTVIARGKIRLAAQRGESIPEGLALDAGGRPTTDAQKAFEGVCLSFGGVKGAALAMLMDVLGGVFTGAAFGGEVRPLYGDSSGPQNVGHLFLAIRPDLFLPREEVSERMDTFVRRAKACPTAEGVDEILMPGEPETRTKQQRSREGLPVTADVVVALKAEAEALNLAFPDPLTDASPPPK